MPSGHLGNQLVAGGEDVSLPIPPSFTSPISVRAEVTSTTFVGIGVELAFSLLGVDTFVDPIAVVNDSSNDSLIGSLKSDGAKAQQAARNKDKKMFSVLDDTFYGTAGFWETALDLAKGATKNNPRLAKSLDTLYPDTLAKAAKKLATAGNLAAFDAEMINVDVDMLRGGYATVVINPVSRQPQPSSSIQPGIYKFSHKYFFEYSYADLELTQIEVKDDGTMVATYKYYVWQDVTWICPIGNPGNITYLVLASGTKVGASSFDCRPGTQPWATHYGDTFEKHATFPAIKVSDEPFSISMIDGAGTPTRINGITLK